MAKWREVKQGKTSKQKNKDIFPKPSSDTNTASIALRLKAFLTDTFLISTPIFYVVIYFLMGGGEEFAQNRSGGWALIFIFHFSIIGFFWIKKAQTPGLRAYSLKLVNYNKTSITLLQVLLRYFATLFAVISFFLIFISFFRKDKLTFQDILSNTYIISE